MTQNQKKAIHAGYKLLGIALVVSAFLAVCWIITKIKMSTVLGCIALMALIDIIMFANTRINRRNKKR